MKTQTDLNPNAGFALLLIGAPKTGKTTLSMAMPDPYFLDCEGNLQAAARRYPGKRFWYDRVDIDDAGVEVPETLRWKRAMELIDKARQHPEVKTIVVDTLNRLSEWLCEMLVNDPMQATKPLVIGGMKCMTQSHWFPFSTTMRRFVGALRSIPDKLIVCNCHEKTDKDEVLGTLLYKPALGGQNADHIGGMFTDVWRCVAEACAVDKAWPFGVKYMVRTMPTPRMQLGNSLGLPADFVFTWDEVAKRIQANSQPTPMASTPK
jgi:hypothetical protein